MVKEKKFVKVIHLHGMGKLKICDDIIPASDTGEKPVRIQFEIMNSNHGR
jgi:hypothetical protein